MKILRGYGKTTYFFRKNKEGRVFHVYNHKQLRSAIHSVKSSFLPKLPTLINTWFPIDFREFKDEWSWDFYLEVHELQTKGKQTKLMKEFRSMWKTMGRELMSSVVICTIPEEALDRGTQPKILNLHAYLEDEEWTDSQFISALGEKYESKWISWSNTSKRNEELFDFLKSYLQQVKS